MIVLFMHDVALYKGKPRLYVCKSPTEVLLLLPKSRHSLGTASPYTGPRFAPDRDVPFLDESTEIREYL